MKTSLLLGLWAIFLFAACRKDARRMDADHSQATVASETGAQPPLPDDVLMVTKPLISGQLYAKPSFESPAIAGFDTSHQLHVLDTTNSLFVKARVQKDTALFTGYVPRAILPERR